MPTKIKMDRDWAQLGFGVMLWSAGAALALSVADGFVRGFVRTLVANGEGNPFETVAVWVADFRFVAEQLIMVGAIIFAAGKFIETCTTLTVGFDRLDAANMMINGPDENNVVWVGQRYDTLLEAEAISETMQSRLKSNTG